MKRIVGGRLFDTQNMFEVASRDVEAEDPVTGVLSKYRETLYREVQLKPGETVDTAYTKKGSYCYRWDKDKVDLRRGEFIFVVQRGWNDDEASLEPLGESAARAWFERCFPGRIEDYEKFFGPPRNQFDSDGRSGLATETVSRLESKIESLEYDVKTEQRHSAEMDEAIKAKDAEIESLRRKLDALEAGV